MHAPLRPPRESVVDRFLRYVRVDTQSAEDSKTTPSTDKQWDLLRILARELETLGVESVRMSEHGMVYAIVRGNVKADIPTIGFLAHVDTSPAVTGTNVRPVIHDNYQGGDITLPGDPSQVITVAQHPVLNKLIGDDIITTDGTTLLGSDDKAGVAAIMTMIDVLAQNPQLCHGRLAIGFTCDEEIGLGIEKFDVEGFGAKFAYTVDGGELGEINDETWSARVATLTFHGKSAHPGTAKGVMVNAIHALGHFIASLPHDMQPETTEGRVGFVHPYIGSADVEQSTLKVILRDFDQPGLDAKEQLLRDIAAETERASPGVRVEIEVKEQYRNMKEIVREHPELIENAMEASRRAGVEPFLAPIRGGTDGSKLTFRGLPCPNIFTGGHEFHSKLEFNSAGGRWKTTETLVRLAEIFVERNQALRAVAER